MIAHEQQLVRLVGQFLPHGAELAVIERPVKHPAIVAADLNGDREPEVAAVYRYGDALYLLVLRNTADGWEAIVNERGAGYGVTLLSASAVTSAARNNLLIGWQMGAIWSQLAIYEWEPGGLRSVLKDPLTYSYIEVLDLVEPGGRDGQSELALWSHDTGEAYRVEVLRWHGGAIVPARDAEPAYFRKVAGYYEQMVRLHPDYAFYWYYWADAQWRAGLPQAALLSVRRALEFPHPYPSREELERLQREITGQLQHGHGAAARAEALFPASLKTVNGIRWGYIDRAGKMVLQPRFRSAAAFGRTGLAAAGTEQGTGLIDTSGRFVVQPIYDSIGEFSEGHAVVIDKEGFKLIDAEGRIVTKRAYSFLGNLHNNRAVFYVQNTDGNSLYGYIDGEGSEVIPARFQEADDFERNRALIKTKEGEYAVIRPDGTQVAVFHYPFVGPPSDGLLAFQQEAGGKYGYIDEKGRVVIQPAYTYAQPFRDGLAVVNTGEDYKSVYGVIDKKGQYVVQPGYNDIRQLGDNRLALGQAIDENEPYRGSIFLVATAKGVRLSDFAYFDVQDYKQGLASVYDRTHTYFIDRTGKAAPGYPRIKGSGTLTLEDGLIAANVDQRLSYWTNDGQSVWRQNSIIPLRDPYRVREVKYSPNKDYLVYYPQLEGMSNPNTQQNVNTKLKELSQVKPVPADQQLESSYTGDFQISMFRKNLLVLELSGYDYPFGAAHGMPSLLYPHIDITTGAFYRLEDLFKPGSDYVKVLSDIVGQQIKDDPQYDYVFPDTYKGIAPDQPFYVSETALHLYFAPYEIGPYAAGFPTFTIPFAQINAILAKDRPFWQSFR
ncbi:WG repeat-containing protein [Paenibacillus xanthanilyticus]|uniref:WG repeat-containing protein n=1 Tax=Paenibacillus xanthanilyticus TaxID=1783531 RepID=A0ABV8K761_9BACL